MKYTIHGFSQREAIRLKLDNDDLLLLRWLSDFSHSRKMKSEVIKGITYYWINYQTLCEDLPIIAMNKRNMARRFKGLSDKKILLHETIKINGTFSYYGFGEAFEDLISDDSDGGYTKNGIGGVPKMVEGVYQKVYNKDLSIINPSTKETHTVNSNNSQDTKELCVEINNILGEKLTQKTIQGLINSTSLDVVKQYMSNWDKYKPFAKTTQSAYFIHCIQNNIPVPTVNTTSQTTATYANFEQREYEESDYEKFYANVRR